MNPNSFDFSIENKSYFILFLQMGLIKHMKLYSDELITNNFYAILKRNLISLDRISCLGLIV